MIVGQPRHRWCSTTLRLLLLPLLLPTWPALPGWCVFFCSLALSTAGRCCVVNFLHCVSGVTIYFFINVHVEFPIIQSLQFLVEGWIDRGKIRILLFYVAKKTGMSSSDPRCYNLPSFDRPLIVCNSRTTGLWQLLLEIKVDADVIVLPGSFFLIHFFIYITDLSHSIFYNFSQMSAWYIETVRTDSIIYIFKVTLRP